MSRLVRNQIDALYIHVMVQGINKEFIFDNDKDKNFFISLLYKFSKEYNIKIVAYCVMNNHTHILVKINQMDDLSKYMHRVNTIYAIYYNKKYDRVGYVFRDRFKTQPIMNEGHLINCQNYIYNNPVKAGICRYPFEYKYSNYKKNKSKINNKNSGNYFIDVDENKENICKKIVGDYLRVNNIEIYNLKRNKKKLKNLIMNLKDNKISYSLMTKFLNIDRKTIYNIIHK